MRVALSPISIYRLLIFTDFITSQLKYYRLLCDLLLLLIKNVEKKERNGEMDGEISTVSFMFW